MKSVNQDRFADPAFLRQLGRPLLDRFLSRFQADLVQRKLLLPPPGALDQEYFNLAAHLFMAPEGLPQELNEAIHEISELASPEGLQRIEQTLELSGASLQLEEQASCGDVAMQVWLADPGLLTQARTLHRLTRLCTFHHFAPGKGAVRKQAATLNDESLAALEAECDAWFAAHKRGRKNTRIDLYVLPEPSSTSGCEHWFLIRHGGPLTRAPKVERGRMDVLHFRPAHFDVGVYNTRRNEIRINARTIGERELYRRAIGRCLFGDPDLFADRKTYTLEPLREHGPEAMETRGVSALERVVLRDYEISLPGPYGRRTIQKASDLFAAVEQEDLAAAIPQVGDLTRATFDLHFAGARTPRPLQLRPPNTLRLSRHADVQAVEAWLTMNGFRVSA